LKAEWRQQPAIVSGPATLVKTIKKRMNKSVARLADNFEHAGVFEFFEAVN